MTQHTPRLWTVSCGPHSVTVAAPDEPAARSIGVMAIRDIDPLWFRHGHVAVKEALDE